MAQLRQRERDIAALGAQVVCILGLDEVRTSYFARNKPGAPTCLSDPSKRVGALYGVARQLFVHEEWVNAPAAYVIVDGVVKWKHVGRAFDDRPTMDTILDRVKESRK